MRVVFVTLDRRGVPSESELHRRQRPLAGLDPVAFRRRLWSHALLRHEAAAHLGLAPEVITLEREESGRPRLAPCSVWLGLSLSRSGGVAALALTSDADVGVDIERVGSAGDAQFAARLLPSGRKAQARVPDRPLVALRRWTRHEAQLKAAGSEFTARAGVPMSTLDIPAPAGYLATVAACAEGLQVFVRDLTGL